MKKILIGLILFLPGFRAIPQTSSKNDDMKFNADYDLMNQDFSKALNLYLKILRSEPNNADIQYRLGICYLHSEDEKDKAVGALEAASQKISKDYNVKSFKETHAPPEAMFLLGSAYRVNNRLDDAINAYEAYKKLIPAKDKYDQEVTDQYIQSCKLAKEMMNQPRNVKFTNLGKVINNNQPNFDAVISANGKELLFTSPGRQGYDVFESQQKDGTWGVPRNITSQLGSGKYLKTSYLSDDGTTLLLVKEDPQNSDIYISHLKNNRWSKAEALKKPINTSANETHASLSPDGQTIYFTSNRKGGYGDLDIYRSQLKKGSWGKPENLGEAVNTPYAEETPFVSADGNTLYFSSEGHNGIGGFDVFRYDLRHPEKAAVNMGYPINTTDNDLFYEPGPNDSTAYFARNEKDSYGGRDIYEVTLLPEKKETEPVMAVKQPAPEDTVHAAAHAAETPAPVVTTPEPVAETHPPVAETPAPVVETPAPTKTVTKPSPVAAVPPEKTTPVRSTPPPAVHTPETTGKAPSFSVQFMALRKPVDLQFFKSLSDIRVTYGQDGWYRYTTASTPDSARAEALRKDLVAKGYTDAFIRRYPVLSRFVIQVMAVPGPVTDLTRFMNLGEISVTRGEDTFCRYTTGAYGSRSEALTALRQIRPMGYPKAFVRKVRTQL